MKERDSIKTVILLALLAAVCVGAAELAACRVMDPDLYEQIITPVRLLYHASRSEVKGISERYAGWLKEQGTERETLAAAQRLRAEERREERLARAEARRREIEYRRLRAEERERLAAERDLLREEQKLLKEAQIATEPAVQENLVTDPALTELRRDEAGREYLTGGNGTLYYYNQGDPAWADALFGRDPVGRYGCGPTALAMAVSSLTDTMVTPAELAAWAGKAGYSAPGSGAYLSIVSGTAEHYGLRCESLAGIGAEELCSRLSEGGIVVALMGPGHFTARGHFILFHGVTLSGNLLAADPNSRANSLAVWDPELILTELSPSRHEGAPLWLLTADAGL